MTGKYFKLRGEKKKVLLAAPKDLQFPQKMSSYHTKKKETNKKERECE